MSQDPHDEALTLLNHFPPSQSLQAFTWYVAALDDPQRRRWVAVEDLARLAQQALNAAL